MARFEFRLPDIGEGIAEAELVAWHVKPGDRVEEDAPLADVMTDKATVEMTAPVSGTVLETHGEAGENIAIGSLLAVFETEGEEAASEAVHTPAEAEGQPSPSDDAATGLRPSPGHGETRILASPAVRARAKALGVDLAQVRPLTGERVRHADLDAYLLYGGAASPARARRTGVEAVKVIGLRRRIAEKMAESKRHIPHFAYVEECDVTALEATRAAMNEGRGERPKLTLLPFLIAAVCRALPDFPQINARYDDEGGIVHRHAAVHMGIATQTDDGLVVPVLRDADSLDLWSLAREVARLADAARAGRAAREELSGSTITITSLGALGGIVSTPVINRPEVAIVGVNRIVERPVAAGGRIEVRAMMNLSSSFDHRVVDGMDAARFIQAVRRLIETPALIFAP